MLCLLLRRGSVGSVVECSARGCNGHEFVFDCGSLFIHALITLDELYGLSYLARDFFSLRKLVFTVMHYIIMLSEEEK